MYSLYRYCIFISLIFICDTAFAQSAGTKIIEQTSCVPGYLYEGAKGLLVNFTYCFASKDPKQFDPWQSGFYAFLSIVKDGRPVSLREEYNAVVVKQKTGKKYTDSLQNAFVEQIIPEMLTGKRDSVYTKGLFIPYAALELLPGKHSISLRFGFDGDDGYGKRCSEFFLAGNMDIDIPEPKKLSITVNRMEVNILNNKGQAWDYSFFGADAPDLYLLISLGGIRMAVSRTVKNSYVFPGGFTRQISICEGDEVVLEMVDRDVSVDDVIERWRVETKNIAINTVYSFSNATANIKSCLIQYSLK